MTSRVKGGVHRIAGKFKELKKRKEKALIIYLTAGDPNLKKNEELIYALEKDGVDLIELGVPFSDPLADGPVIQEASQRALKKKTNVVKILKLVKKIRNNSQIPILLMTYLNPILRYGVERFAGQAKASGVDGIIFPDLPPDEGGRISFTMNQKGIDLVYLAAPTSTKARIKRIARASHGFIYYVSMTGVTGVKRSAPFKLDAAVRVIKRNTKLPVCVGFGVSTPQQAAEAARSSDGVIVGSAVVKALAANSDLGAGEFSKLFIRPFAKALGKRK
jgi:tryptophan synthase alpha chain